MKRAVYILTILLISFLGALSSCSGGKTEKTEVAGVQTPDTAYEDYLEIMLPSPSEVIEIVLTSGIKYSNSYLAPIGIEKKAALVKHKAVTLGVYFTDFAYANFYNQRNVSSEYFKVLQDISRDLGIGSILNDVYFKRFDANLNNPDSLDAIFEDFSQNAYTTLTESGNSEILSMIGIGAAIEILYIGVNSIENAANRDEAIETVMEHSAIFENYYKNFMAYNNDKPEFNQLVSDVSRIFDFFKQKVTKQTNENVTPDGANHFTISGGEKAKLSKTDLAELKKMVTDTRKKLIELGY